MGIDENNRDTKGHWSLGKQADNEYRNEFLNSKTGRAMYSDEE
jgi:hypothetical protein